jgi:DNA (cytosine-5)-methyltransferase 1
MSKKTFGSLFAGVGGFDLGMEQAGWDCQWQVEWDKHCHNVLTKHWPDVPKYWDVRDVDGAKLTPVDCIVFGSPCQDLSVAGKGGGLEGSRSGLFHEAIRIIKEMRNATSNEFPKWSIWENVPGALSSNKGNDFAKVIDEMADIGALAIEWHILDAQWFGVAQRRRRVFVLACYDSGTASRCPEQILSVPEDSKRNIKQSRKERKQASRQTEASSGEFSIKDGQIADKDNVTVFLPGTMVRQGSGVSENVVPTLRAEHHNGDNFPHIAYQQETPISFHAKQVPISSDNVSQTLYGQNGVAVAVPIIVDGTRVNDVRIYDQGIVPTLKHRMGTGGGQVPLVGIEEPVLSYDGYNNAVSENIYRTLRIGIDSADHIAIPIQGTIIGRSDNAGPQGKGYGEENDPSYTLDTISQHGVMTPELILRKLTPLECERLMGFPDEHTKYYANGKVVADTNRYKMCGNAVASPVAKWIGEKIYAI